MNTALKLLRPQVLSTARSPTFLRRCSSEHNPSPPLPPPVPVPQRDPVVIQAVQLLQPPHNEWDLHKLTRLLLSSPPPSPRTFFHITRRLSSTDKALQFLRCLETISASSNVEPLAFCYQAIFEFATRDRDSPDKVLELYKQSRERNIPLTVNAATLLLRWFGKAGMLNEALSVVSDLDSSLRSTHVLNAFVDAMFRYGRVDVARKVLDKMLPWDSKFPPNETTGHIVFRALSNGEGSGSAVNVEETAVLVLKLFEHGVVPATRSLGKLATKLCKAGKIDWAWDIVHDAVKLGGQMDTYCCNSLLIGLGRARDYKRVNTLLEEMKEMGLQPNAWTLKILINMMCYSGMVDSALELFEKLKHGEDGVSIKPDLVLYNSMITGLCNNGRLGEGLDLMEQMRSLGGHAPDRVTYTSLVGGFSRGGEVKRARELLDQMRSDGLEPDVATLNAAVIGMCKYGVPDSAVELVNEMQHKGLEGDACTYATMIEAYCKVMDIDKGRELFDRMVKGGHSPNVTLYYTLISGLSQAGRMGEAMEMVSKLKEAGFGLDVVCFNTLISGFCRKDKKYSALKLLREMKKAGVKPDCFTYNMLISYLHKKGNLALAQMVEKQMIAAGLEPDAFTFGQS